MILELVTVIICVCLNAFFSAYEMAFVTVSRTDEEAIKLQKKKFAYFKSSPERTLSIIQIGITLVGTLAAAVGGAGAVEGLVPILEERTDISGRPAEAISVIVIIIPLTYVNVLFGELIPKAIAMRHQKFILNSGTRILDLMDNFLSPIVGLLYISTKFFLKFVPLKSEVRTEEQLVDIGPLPDFHKQFVINLVDMKDRPMKNVLVPWKKVVWVNFTDSNEEVMKKTRDSAHSRFPVVDEDTIVGFIHMKELSALTATGGSWERLIRPMITVNENEKILTAFLKMQKEHQHMAGVINEKAKLIGITTLENILETIVGDIEEDIPKDKITKLLARRRRFNFGNDKYPT